MEFLGALTFRLASWWRTSSGHTDGDRLDDVIVRSPDGLPWLPGRTVKGLARDALYQLERLGHYKHGTTAVLFGTDFDLVPDNDVPLAARYQTKEGALRFGSAQMPETWRNWAAGVRQEGVPEDKDVIEALFDRRTMTAMDIDTSTAKTSSLRSVEVAAPLELTAPVWTLTPSTDDREALVNRLDRAARLIKCLGAGRHRGFGRSQVRFIKTAEAVA